jgi:hypothetical protein
MCAAAALIQPLTRSAAFRLHVAGVTVRWQGGRVTTQGPTTEAEALSSVPAAEAWLKPGMLVPWQLLGSEAAPGQCISLTTFDVNWQCCSGLAVVQKAAEQLVVWGNLPPC